MTMPFGQPAPQLPGPGPAQAIVNLSHLNRLAQQRAAGHRPLTDEERAELDQHPACIHCGGWHTKACPRVKKLRFYANGKIEEVEYWPSSEVDWSNVVWDLPGQDPEQVE